jgi:hypothetical protein
MRSVVAAVACVLALDAVIAAVGPSRFVVGVADEVAHALTTLVLIVAVAAAGRWGLSRRSVLTAIAASVAIDVDHVPHEVFGSSLLMGDLPRPYTHSITTVVVLCALALAVGPRWRWAALWSAAGVIAHLVRDLATAPVALLWPGSDADVRMPYVAYAALLVTAGAAHVGRCLLSGRTSDPP